MIYRQVAHYIRMMPSCRYLYRTITTRCGTQYLGAPPDGLRPAGKNKPAAIGSGCYPPAGRFCLRAVPDALPRMARFATWPARAAGDAHLNRLMGSCASVDTPRSSSRGKRCRRFGISPA